MPNRNEHFNREESIEAIIIDYLQKTINKNHLEFIHNKVENKKENLKTNALDGDLIILNKNDNSKIKIDLKRSYKNLVFISKRFIQHFKGNYILIYSLDANKKVIPDSVFLFNPEWTKAYFKSCEKNEKPYDKGYYSGDIGYKYPISEFKTKRKINELNTYL